MFHSLLQTISIMAGKITPKKPTSYTGKHKVTSPKNGKLNHPPYKIMVKEAVTKLNEKSGSSRAAIVKYINANYKVGDQSNLHVRMALRTLVVNQELVHASSTTRGASGSFKLPPKVNTVKTPAAPSKVRKSTKKATLK